MAHPGGMPTPKFDPFEAFADMFDESGRLGKFESRDGVPLAVKCSTARELGDWFVAFGRACRATLPVSP